MYSAGMKLSNPLSKSAKKSKINNQSLNKWNKVLAVLHFVQGVAVLALTKGVTWPVTTSFLTQDTLVTKSAGRPVLSPATHTLFNVNIAYLVAIFFFLSALAHAIIATRYRATYEANLKKGINKARWIEYSLSASVMMVAIALLSGIYDFSSLLMIFVLIAIMNITGLFMEIQNQGARKVNWSNFILGCVAYIVPWIVFVAYILGANIYGSGGIPTFVYWIYATMFVLFSSFAANMLMQYRKSGKWADYLYGERVYMILSLVAKSLLAWQVFFGSLRP